MTMTKTEQERLEHFIRVARKLEFDEDEERWDEFLNMVAKGEPESEKPE